MNVTHKTGVQLAICTVREIQQEISFRKTQALQYIFFRVK
jgi:hypothetical protein